MELAPGRHHRGRDLPRTSTRPLLSLAQANFHYLHVAGAALLFGIFLGATINGMVGHHEATRFLVFKESFFFLVLLPPIIFESVRLAPSQEAGNACGPACLGAPARLSPPCCSRRTSRLAGKPPDHMGMQEAHPGM